MSETDTLLVVGPQPPDGGPARLPASTPTGDAS